MQLDAESLSLLTRVADIRRYISTGEYAAGLTHWAGWLRKQELLMEIETIKDRLLNQALRAAGLHRWMDPATLPLPGAHAGVATFPAPPPERPKVKALEIPEMTHK